MRSVFSAAPIMREKKRIEVESRRLGKLGRSSAAPLHRMAPRGETSSPGLLRSRAVGRYSHGAAGTAAGAALLHGVIGRHAK